MFCCSWIFPAVGTDDNHLHHWNFNNNTSNNPGALGLREATMVGLFLVVGVPADIVLAASLIDWLISYLMPTIVGAITTVYYGKLLNKMEANSS